ncbi:hypothetical protein XENTR_v10022375 [Xenopus tropicalis]|nr:hypothetical protein XENTR_v10022375 [Xenopus tropicalis]
MHCAEYSEGPGQSCGAELSEVRAGRERGESGERAGRGGIAVQPGTRRERCGTHTVLPSTLLHWGLSPTGSPAHLAGAPEKGDGASLREMRATVSRPEPGEEGYESPGLRWHCRARAGRTLAE